MSLPPRATLRSLARLVPYALAHLKTSIKTTITNPSALRKQATLTRYTIDSDYKRQHDSLLHTEVTRYFPGHGTFKGKITKYYPATDTYSIIYDDNDTEVQSYKDIQSMIPGTDAYVANQVNMHALSLAFSAAAAEAQTAPSLRLQRASVIS